MTAPLSNRTKHLQAIDNANHLHPFTLHKDLRAEGPRVISGAKGVYITDTEGHKTLDGMAGLWCVNLGYGVQELNQAAMSAMSELSYYNTFFKTTTPPTAELAEAIAARTPADLNTVFFASSGSEANDSAVKLIWYYWNLKGKPKKKHIIARERAYHGSTIVGASLSGLAYMQGDYDLPLDRFHHISPPPHRYNYARPGESDDAFAARCAQALEDKILELGPDNVAAFVGEPVMGAGGLMIPPDGYWSRIEAICRKYNVLLWSDEVICGFGRLGEWFGCQKYGFTPDIITMAKGLSSGYLPISALALNGEIGNTIAQSDAAMSHGFTYSGHPVPCAVALKTIELLEEWDLCGARGAETIAYFGKAMSSLADHPIIAEVRTSGLLGAIEIVKDKSTGEFFPDAVQAGPTCRGHALDAGLMTRMSRSGGDTIMLSPPLIISNDEIDEIVSILSAALDKTQAQFS